MKGQMGIKELLGIGGAIAVAVISGWFGQASRTDAALELAKEEQRKNNLALVERVTANETKVDNLQSDIKEVKADVKTLLKLLK